MIRFLYFLVFAVGGALAQDFSVIGAGDQEPVGALLSLGVFRPVHYTYQDFSDFDVRYRVQVFYTDSQRKNIDEKGFSKGHRFQVEWSYSHALKKVAEPRLFGSGDIEGSIIYAFNRRFQSSVHVILPTSYISRRDSLLAAGELGVYYNVLSPVYLVFSHFLSVNTHKRPFKNFSSSYIHNDALSLSHSVTWIQALSKKFLLQSSVGLYWLYGYGGKAHHVLQGEWRLVYSFKEGVSAFVSYVKTKKSKDALIFKQYIFYDSAFLAAFSIEI